MKPSIGFWSALALIGVLPAYAPACRGDPASGLPFDSYAVVNVFPHDRGAFTEGLTCLGGGVLLESTGLYGSSTLRKVDLRTGRVLQEVKLPADVFGEGTTALDGKVYQLTWKRRTGFVYDLASLRKVGEFDYSGEGWGLTTDGRSLIMSDGTNRIRFLDPATFAVTRTIDVTLRGQPLERLNELEYVRGQIYANIWESSFVARIDPATGRLLGLIDLFGLLQPADRDSHTDVLNGIAFDPASGRLFVTGKDWPKLFEIRLKPK
ncbi:MAG: glutaminyl-peptide cyclotransferase [Opitutaceae bacterium]